MAHVEPALSADERDHLVRELMAARRKIGTMRRASDEAGEGAAHDAVDRTKRALGERGPVWWDDGASDLNRHMARTTTYAEWYADLSEKGTETRKA